MRLFLYIYTRENTRICTKNGCFSMRFLSGKTLKTSVLTKGKRLYDTLLMGL